MSRIAATIGLILLLVHVRASRGEEVPPLDNTVENSNLAIASVLADWQSHRFQIPSGRFDWQLRSRIRAPQLNDLAGHPLEATEEQQQVQVRFNSQGLKLEGDGVASLRFGGASLPDNDWKSNRTFAISMGSSFSNMATRSPSLGPYTVLVDSTQETHIWRRGTDSLDSVAMFLPGTAGPLLIYDSSKAAQLPLLLALIEPLQLAVRPELLFQAEAFSTNAKVLASHPIVEGHACLAIEYPLTNQAAGVCQLWLNPHQNYAVVRATYQSPEGANWAQYDIEYDSENSKICLPNKITILQFNSFGDAYDELQAVRSTSHFDTEENAELMSFQPSPGTWVIDQRTQEQYQVGDGGARRVVTLAEAVKAATSDVETGRKTFSGYLGWTSIQSLLVRSVTWPWILATLVIVYGIRQSGRSKFRQQVHRID